MFVLKARDGNFRKVKTRPTAANEFWTVDLDREPSPTISAGGIRGCFISQHHIEHDGAPPPMADTAKPPYRVPLMSEIAKLPWNGLTVVSTFAGAGGSSTGYRMAGYRVLLANEFVPIAQESYAANMGPHTQLAREDIKDLTGPEILRRVGLKPGELDVLDGSPPCQAFSTAGKREKGWGTDREYAHGAKQKNEDLFDEYVRLVRWLQPKVFVAENVSGLVKGTAKGYFLNILAALKACGYLVEAQLLDAQWLGVPQARQRIIFVGVRADLAALGFKPTFPRPLPYRYSVREAIPHVAKVFHDTRGSFKIGGTITDRPSVTILSSPFDSHHFQVTDEEVVGIGGRGGFGNVVMTSPGEPAATIGTGPSSGNGLNPPGELYVKGTGGEVSRRKFTIPELMRICAFPDDYVLKGKYAQQWERLGNSVPPVMMFHVAAAIRDAVLLPARARESGPGPRSAGRSTTGTPPKGAGTRPPGGAPVAATRAGEPASARRPGTRSRRAGRAGEAPGGPP